MSGPLTRTIMAFTSTPTSAETKASALRMSVAPMVASRTPIHCVITHLRCWGRQGRRLFGPARLRNPFHNPFMRSRMRVFSASGFLALPALLFAGGVLPLAAQDSAHQARHEHGDKGQHDDPDRAVAGGGSVPAGWTVRTDAKAGTANVKVVPMGKGMHVTLGPAIILYQDKHAGTGPFHTLATFTLTKPSTHPEGYGLFFGGQALTGAGQKYTYFLIRQDGKYLVKRREGDKTTDVTKGWVESA